MEQMRYIDSDSHVEEGSAVWDYLEPRFRDRKPQIVNVNYEGSHKHRDNAWLIDGRVFPHPFGRNPVNFSTPATMTWARMKPVSIESQMLCPASARLKDMDLLGISVQVNYPTLFLEYLTQDRALEAALMQAWNRWIVDSVSEHKDRLKWVALIPFWNVEEALSEISFAKEHGAVGAYTLGTVYDDFLSERSFDPIYAACEDMNLPVCVHIGWAHGSLNRSCDSMLASILFTFEQSLLHALYSFVAGGVLDRFSKLRVGFLEGPVGHYLTLIRRIEYWRQIGTAQPMFAKELPRHYIEQGRLFFSCEGDEEGLAEFAREVGEEHVVLTGDFPHVHFQGDRLCSGLTHLASRADLNDDVKWRIAVANGANLYQIPLPQDAGPKSVGSVVNAAK